MYVEGQYADGAAVARNVPVLVGGVDAAGNAQTLKVGTDGSITVSVETAAGTASNTTTTAYAASLVIKNAPATLFGLTGYNSKTSTQFIQLHDATSLPSNTAVPKVVFSVAASSPFSLDYGDIGRLFTTGIVVANSSTGATLTVGSADCWFDAQYLTT